MFYDNQSYWTDLHEKFGGEFKAVGHPFLSESMNQLKYESEAKAFLTSLEKVVAAFKKTDQTELSILDIGAGYGYWTSIAYELLSHNGYKVDVSALDISTKALTVLKERLPYADPIVADLKTIAPDNEQGNHDFVFSCYCLHHLTRAHDFFNALQFAAQSVKLGGFLLIMDPILSMPFSKADTLDFQTYRGNGIPRHLYYIDDVVAKLGLTRCLKVPAVSFLLNENIEAYTRLGYSTMMLIWKLMCRLDRVKGLVQSTSGILRNVDSFLKRNGLAFSSSVCVYQKMDDRGV